MRQGNVVCLTLKKPSRTNKPCSLLPDRAVSLSLSLSRTMNSSGQRISFPALGEHFAYLEPSYDINSNGASSKFNCPVILQEVLIFWVDFSVIDRNSL